MTHLAGNRLPNLLWISTAINGYMRFVVFNILGDHKEIDYFKASYLNWKTPFEGGSIFFKVITKYISRSKLMDTSSELALR